MIKIQRNGIYQYESAVFRLCFLMMILLANFTESSFARDRDLLTFVFYIIAIDCAPSRKQPDVGAKSESCEEERRYGLGHAPS
jgi:hypothetical protein